MVGNKSDDYSANASTYARYYRMMDGTASRGEGGGVGNDASSGPP